MKLSINQPAYIPWLGFFNRIYKSDIFVILDHVEFEKNSMINRNKIKTNKGPLMLTVPLKTKGKFQNLAINNIEIDNRSNWQRKHFNSICQSYSKSKFFYKYYEFLENIYFKKWDKLIDLVNQLNLFILEELKIETKILYSSQLSLNTKKSQLILDICKKFNAKTYLSGPFGKDYLDLNKFESSEIKVEFHEYKQLNYDQLYGDFESHLSIIDLLFNCGPKSVDIIKL
tara:strand:+ start:1282 stop:1965 length:684 start_codon:yes stop_codon:yes gene_type:complete